MARAPATPATLSELPFLYVGGDASLDLVNTVDWTGRGPEAERLTSYERLTEWAEGAGVLAAPDALRLRRLAGERPRAARAALAEARRLRAVLQALFSEVAAGSPAPAALEAFNAQLAGSLSRLHLALVRQGSALADGGRATDWAWQGVGEDLRSPLWPVAWRAAALLTSQEAGKVRVCAGPDCGWMYVDRSRNRLRRWCRMESCGTQAKSRRRASKRRRAAPARRAIR